MSEVFLNQFKIVQPKNHLSQETLLNWIITCHQQAARLASPTAEKSAEKIAEARFSSETIEKLFRRYGVDAKQIAFRNLECGDIVNPDQNQYEIYRLNAENPFGVGIGDRARFFSNRAEQIFKDIYDLQNTTVRPDHLIHVTCTGYVSPSAAQKIVTEKNWGRGTDITHAYHMGCYAAMPAVRLARSLVQSESNDRANFTADIVHTEMCSLHMNPQAQTPEQMVVQTLFADGHIKYTASAQPLQTGRNLKVIAMLEKVLPDSQQDMSWIPAPWGLQMNLSREVPNKIKAQLKSFSDDLFFKAGLQLNEALASVFAIHPGGPKIIDAVRDSLGLRENQITASRKVLFERGNMSSATLPHVWSEILNQNHPVGTKVTSYAFGPGLTLFGSVFEVC